LQDEIDFKNQEIHEFQAELRIRDQKIADLGNPPDHLFKQKKQKHVPSLVGSIPLGPDITGKK
jgi:hypothetical protein